jgi:hypothetical protein
VCISYWIDHHYLCEDDVVDMLRWVKDKWKELKLRVVELMYSCMTSHSITIKHMR